MNTVTVDTLIRRFDLGNFDVIKLDIEGAEVDVLTPPAGQPIPKESYLPFLDTVQFITVEWHDDIRKNSQRIVKNVMRVHGLEANIVGPRQDRKIPSYIFSKGANLFS